MLRARAVLTVAAVLIACIALAAVADEATVTLQRSTDRGLRVHVDPPADGAAWHGLVALPPGTTPQLIGAAAGVQLGETAIMHGVRVAPLTVLRGGEVELSFAPAVGQPPARTTIARTFGNLIASQALGGETIRGQLDEVPGTYLMICSSALGAVEAVEPLAEWRRQQGYAVQIATTLQTGTTPSQIKSYIQEVYDTAVAPLAYVVLVGDATGAVNVATWRESISGYYGEGDHEYTRLDGDDVLADVHVGRLTARSITELEGIVDKILAYERNPDTFSDPGWFKRALLVGDPSASGTSTIYVNQWLKEQLLALDYTQIDTIWSPPFASQIFQKMNQGVSVYAYRGYLGCSGFNPGYIDNLTNAGELPFAIMPTCASGSFEDTHTYSEAMLRNPNGGAIGAVGTATTGTHTRYNNCYFHGAWEGALNEPDRHLGYAHTRGKLELFRQYQANEPDIVEIWSTWNNLMGDPATEMRQALPTVPQVAYPTVLPPDAGTVPVVVTSGGQPLPDMRVTVWRDAAVQVTRWTDTGGQVLLPVPTGLEAGALSVTVTGDDLMPYRGQLQVGSVMGYCASTGWIWADGNDQMPAPGETGELSVQLQNLGQASVAAVEVSLDAAGEGVTIAGGPITVGSIAAGQTVTVASWTVTLAADLADGGQARLAVRATASLGSWDSQITLPMTAPAFTLLGADWQGTAGQTADLTITLRNDGSIPAHGATATFATTSAFLMPAGPTSLDLGDVTIGEQTAATFPLAVAPAAWGGHLASCTVTVTTGAGTQQVVPFSVSTTGAGPGSPVGPGTMDYLAWDDEDPSPDAPTYAWRELDPGYGGAGTDVGLTDFAYEQDDSRTVELPFTFRYRGRDYDQVTICSNGWVALGQTYLVHWRNWALPAAGSPEVMLAVFWDDLSQSGSNRVYQQYDAEDGVYVVQWSRMRNRWNGLQNCQIVLHDPAVHETATGDGLIVYQYQQVTNNDTSRGYATVGIQDGTDGLTYTYYNEYASGARPLAAGRAIAFVPTPPAAAATIAVTPAAIDAVVLPGQSTERTLTLENAGATGSVLHWQLQVREASPAPAPALDDPAGRDRIITVLAPDGGENWVIGQARDFAWTADGGVSRVNVQLDRGEGWQTIASNVDAEQGSYLWFVSGPSSGTCRARIVDVDDVFVSDVSDGTFTITADIPWLSVDTLAGQIAAGETSEITVGLDATNLEIGQYTAELVILSSGGAPVVVPIDMTVGTSTPAAELPASLDLAAARPNPFNPRTTLAFALPRAGHVRLTVHDLRGRLVRTLVDGARPAGDHQVAFDGTDLTGRSLPSGTYVYRLVTDDEALSGRMTLVK